MKEWPAAQKLKILRYRANNELDLPPLQPVSTDLKIVSEDGVTILMPRNAARQSTFIRDLLDDTLNNTSITVSQTPSVNIYIEWKGKVTRQKS